MMRSNSMKYIAVILVLLVSTLCGAAEGISPFPYMKDLTLRHDEAAGLCAVEIDDELYAALNDGYFNLRIVDKNRQEIRYLVRDQKASGNDKTYPLGDLDSAIVRTRKGDSRTVTRFTTHRQPLVSLQLDIPDANFVREASVAVREDDSEDWKTIVRQQITSVEGRRAHDRDVILELGTTCRSRLYRVTVENADNPPLEIRGVLAKGVAREILFLSTSDETQYVLYYGGSSAKPPDYDIATIVSRMSPSSPAGCSLSEQRQNPDFNAESVSLDFFKSRSFFMSAIAIMVVVLVWAVAIGAKRVEETSGPTST